LKDCPKRGEIPGDLPLPHGNFHFQAFLRLGLPKISNEFPKIVLGVPYSW
jgi:hypothetical protein